MRAADGPGLHLLDAIARIGACGTQDELARAAATACARVRTGALSSAMLSGPLGGGTERFHFSTWPPEWDRAYRIHRWGELDPAFGHARRSGAAIGWAELARALPPDDRGHAVFRAAAALGFADGLVTPVRSARGRLGVVCALSRGPGPAGAHRDFLQAVCSAVLHRAEAIAEQASCDRAACAPDAWNPDFRIPAFSARERECLELLLAGHTDREIAARLGISVSTARFHVDNARIKAGARSRVHLAATAARWL